MKESKSIIKVFVVFMIIVVLIFFVLKKFGLDTEFCFNIATNLCCGGIVGLVTAICQFLTSRRRIVNAVYVLYFDLYRTYYYSKNKRFLYHYNVVSIYKKITELSPKINEVLDEYHGFFIEHDKLYRKMNPVIKLDNKYKEKMIIKTLLWFNKKPFNNTIGSYIEEVEKILININEKRFNKDKEDMIKMFNYIWK